MSEDEKVLNKFNTAIIKGEIIMDIGVKMWMWEKDGKAFAKDDFDLIAFYPGRLQDSVPMGKYWSDLQADRSLLRVGNLITTAFKLDYIVIYKPSDKATQTMMNAHLKKTRLEGKLDVHLRTNKASEIQYFNQGSYTFDFKVAKLDANQRDDEGNVWDIALLKIIDKTEDMSFPG